MRYSERCEVSVLLGKVLKSVERTAIHGEEEIRFVTEDGEQYLMKHSQDCCEYVNIEEVIGDLSDLVGEPLVEAEESTSDVSPDNPRPTTYEDGAEMWTFYRFGTRKGPVVIRWFGSSNGYYGVGVDFYKLPKTGTIKWDE